MSAYCWKLAASLPVPVHALVDHTRVNDRKRRHPASEPVHNGKIVRSVEYRQWYGAVKLENSLKRVTDLRQRHTGLLSRCPDLIQVDAMGCGCLCGDFGTGIDEPVLRPLLAL